MVTISKDNDVVTLINVFTVAPEDQQRLVDVLADATQAVMRQPTRLRLGEHPQESRRYAGHQLRAVAEYERRLRLCSRTKKRPSTWGRRPG